MSALRDVPGGASLASRSRFADHTKSLHPFSRLPCEIRWMIWQWSLKPRTIELDWIQSRGFFSRVATPPALRVNRDSRTAIRHLYSLCFGNPMSPPKTLCNFDLDTLLILEDMQSYTLQLFAGLTTIELANLQHIAISATINENYVHGGETDDNTILALSQMAPRLLSLKMISVAFDLQYNYEGNEEGGTGPCEIYANRPPAHFYHECGPMQNWLDDMLDEYEKNIDKDEHYEVTLEAKFEELLNDFPADLCDCNELPEVPSEFKVIKGPNFQSVWMWRPG